MEIKDLKSWLDLAHQYPMIMFNEGIKLNDGEILQEWAEAHHCQADEAGAHIDNCEIKDCAKCKELKKEWGDNPSCECESYQWFIIDIDEDQANELNKEFGLDIFYSEVINNFIIPVYHFGTSWSIMGLKGGYVNL